MSQDPNPNTQNPPQAASQEKTAETKRYAPPTTITNLLIYENSCFWYQLSCCDPNAPHIGVLISFDEQPITGCEAPMPVAVVDEIKLERTAITSRTTAVTRFCIGKPSNGNTEEPLGLKKGYLVEDYVKIVGGHYDARLIKIMKVWNEKNQPILVGRILPTGKKMDNAVGATLTETLPNNLTGNEAIMVVNIELAVTGIKYERVLILAM